MQNNIGDTQFYRPKTQQDMHTSQSLFMKSQTLGDKFALIESSNTDKFFNNSKRELKNLLIKKYVNKYAKQDYDQAKTVVQIILDFLKFQKINTISLDKLEQIIQEEAKNFKEPNSINNTKKESSLKIKKQNQSTSKLLLQQQKSQNQLQTSDQKKISLEQKIQQSKDKFDQKQDKLIKSLNQDQFQKQFKLEQQNEPVKGSENELINQVSKTQADEKVNTNNKVGVDPLLKLRLKTPISQLRMDNRVNSFTEANINKDLQKEAKAISNRSHVFDNIAETPQNQFRIKTSQSKKLLTPSYDNFMNSQQEQNDNNNNKISQNGLIVPITNYQEQYQSKQVKIEKIENPKYKRTYVIKDPLYDLIPGYPDINKYFNLDDDRLSVASSLTTKSIYKTTNNYSNDEWTLLMNQDVQDFLKEKKQKQQFKVQQMKDMRDFLDKQQQEKLFKMNKEKEETGQYIKQRDQILEKFDEQEKHINDKRKQKQQDQLFQFEKQIQEINQYKKQEATQRKKINKIIQQENNELRIQNIQKKNQKKQNDILAFQKMIKDSQDLQNQKEKQQIEERNQDKIREKIAFDIFDQREKQKEQEFQSRLNKQQNVLNSKSSQKIYEDFLQKKKYYEDLVAKYEKEKLEEFDQKEKDKQNQIKNLKENMKQVLAQQVKTKEEQKLQDKIDNEKQAQIWQMDTKNYFKELDDSRKHFKQVQLQYDEKLKNQIDQQFMKTQDLKKMNDQEYLINKNKLKTLKDKEDVGNYLERGVLQKYKFIF